MAYDHILQTNAGNTYYSRLVDRWTGYVWNGTAMADNPTYSSSVIDVTDLDGDGDYGFVAPTALPEGHYKLSYRLQAGGSPANTDRVVASVAIKREWDGKISEEA